MKYLLFLILFAPLSWAQIETEKTVIQNLNMTKAEEAKPFLLHQAIKESLAQYAGELGIDPLVFENLLVEKFKIYFEAHKVQQLSERFGKTYASELSEEQKKGFVDGLESHRTAEFIKFAQFDQLVDSYGFKSIENDPAKPGLWKGIIVLKLNRTKISQFSTRLTTSDSKPFSRIQMLANIDLMGVSWADLGFESSSLFLAPIMNSWLKWINANKAENVGDALICSGSCVQEFSQWQQIPQEQGMSVPEPIANGLWLKLSFNVRKLTYSANINEWTFSWEGSAVLLDINTKRIVSSFTILPETRVFRNLDQKALNSALASSLYRSSLDALNKTMKKLQDSPKLNRLNRLIIQGHRHLGDVSSLIDFLRKEGRGLHLQLQTDVISQKEAQVLCIYQGEEKSFTDLLSRVKELKSSQSYRIVNEFTGVHQVLKLVGE